MNQFVKYLKSIRYLGLPKLWHYACYQIGLRSGHYRRVTPNLRQDYDGVPGLPPLVDFPQVNVLEKENTLAEADEICQGFVRLFGSKPVPLELEIGASSEHWADLAMKPTERDIKFIWEPARFGWAITLARAYAFSGDDVYAQDFWDKTLTFIKAHPPNLGRQWQSAQEVAIRLIIFIFCDRVFASAPATTIENRKRLWEAVAEHAQRIPPTLVYARAQNNNHLISEAAGLYAAGIYLPDHPHAKKWRLTGWRWLNWAFQHQIDEFGTYVQHSTNYHRLMLQIALITDYLRRETGQTEWPLATHERLEAATRWLWALTDPKTGLTPNLGANDGAYILPLTNLPFADFRPTVDACAKAFLSQDIYDCNELAEMANWFNLQAAPNPDQHQPHAPDMLRVESEDGRAFLRSAHFSDRPSHADQLHADLWWQGVNIALDPGTYQYNAPPPWDNALATTKVHNTLILDGHDQMLPAGRFLWLDWAQSGVLAHEIDQCGRLTWVTAEHDGYRKQKALHQRLLTSMENGWEITDNVHAYGRPDAKTHQARLTWLLPDWPWNLVSDHVLQLTGSEFSFDLQIEGAEQLNIFRAGECLRGEMTAKPSWGWTSPTYSIKVPALMIVAVQSGKLPLKFQSTYLFKV